MLFFGGIALAAPSFDCSRVSAPIEKVVCANSDLSDLDAELSKSFSTARQQLDTSHAERLLGQQRAWLGSRVANCHVTKDILASKERTQDVANCLVNLYRDRVNGLNALAALKGDWVDDIEIEGETHSVITLKEMSNMIAFFNKQSIQWKLHDRILDCNLIVNIPYYRANNYGGICSVDRGGQYRNVEICADDMVGNLKIKDLPEENVPTRDLARFVLTYCTGG